MKALSNEERLNAFTKELTKLTHKYGVGFDDTGPSPLYIQVTDDLNPTWKYEFYDNIIDLDPLFEIQFG